MNCFFIDINEYLGRNVLEIKTNAKIYKNIVSLNYERLKESLIPSIK